jgi:ATP-dependent protease ClpP protease subunit
VLALIIDRAQHGPVPKTSLLILLVLALQSVELRAELVFRSLEQANGRQSWSAIKKYSNPRDVDYAARPAEQVRVFVTGEITGEDAVSARVMENLIQAGRHKVVGNTIWLASNGGDIDAAMVLGRILRRHGVFTIVGKDDQCLSACVFAFMGGERRVVAGRLGVHRPFFRSTQVGTDRQARFRNLQNVVRAYFDELDFPPALYEEVMAVPSESMKFLAPAEIKQFHLEGIRPSSAGANDPARPQEGTAAAATRALGVG